VSVRNEVNVWEDRRHKLWRFGVDWHDNPRVQRSREPDEAVLIRRAPTCARSAARLRDDGTM